MVVWLISAGAVIVVAVTTALWWWGLTPWLIPTAAAVVIAVAEVWWWVPRWQANSLRLQVRNAKDRADLEDSFRKSIGQLFGGAAVLIGAGFAYYQSQLAQQASQNQIAASRDQLISQQVSRGFEQLASDKLAMRLGGIYTLEGVMNASEQYHKPVLEALCAFVREGTKVQAVLVDPAKGVFGKSSLGNSMHEPLPPATDIQAALAVIGRRAHTADVARLPGANLSGIDLGVVISLSGSEMSGVDLSRAALPWADLSRANLSEANLSEAVLIRSNLSGAFLIRANLRETRLQGADLSGAILIRTNLSGALMTDTKVSQSQLDEACGDEKTRLPAGMTIKRCPEGAQ
jgi:hypothetical protein